MMAPVNALARYMAHVDGAVQPAVFVDDRLVIVADFEPFIFRGKDAAAQWDAGYRQHAVPLKEVEVTFGPANAFERAGDRVYFVLPTTWRGIYKDRRFEEHGAGRGVRADKFSGSVADSCLWVGSERLEGPAGKDAVDHQKVLKSGLHTEDTVCGTKRNEWK